MAIEGCRRLDVRLDAKQLAYIGPACEETTTLTTAVGHESEGWFVNSPVTRVHLSRCAVVTVLEVSEVT